jgi:hypothetical protein
MTYDKKKYLEISTNCSLIISNDQENKLKAR